MNNEGEKGGLRKEGVLSNDRVYTEEKEER